MPEDTILGAIQEMSRRIGEPLDTIAASIGGIRLKPYTTAVVDSRETVLVTYSIGLPEDTINGRPGGVSFDEQDGVKYGLVNKNMYKLDGTYDGTNQVVSQPFDPAVMPSPPKGFDPTKEIYKRPKAFPGPWDKGSPIDAAPPRSSFKAIWSFNDEEKSNIYGAGVTQLLLVPLKPPKCKQYEQLFELPIGAIITGGTGKYEGATGMVTTAAAAFIPAGVDFFSIPPGAPPGPAVSIEAFRIILKKDWDEDEADKRAQR